MQQPENQNQKFNIKIDLNYPNKSIASYYYAIWDSAIDDLACASQDEKVKNRKKLVKFYEEKTSYANAMYNYYSSLDD